MNNKTGVLRQATREDIPAIVELIKQNLDTLLPRSAAEIENLLHATWVIDEESEIVGVAMLEVYCTKLAEIRSVAVRKDRRGCGYGAQLVQRVVDEARKLNIPEILAVTSNLEFFKAANFGQCLNEKYAVFWNGK